MYDAFSSDYDRFVNWQGRLTYEMPFIEKQLGKLARPALAVLDSACGTGMHALELKKRGYQASGADLSSGMIERARVNAAQVGEDVVFQVAGFGELAHIFGISPFGDELPFDAVLCMGNSLPHLLSLDELSRALADFRQCLSPDGLVLIQNRNFDAVLAKNDRWMEPQSYQEADAEWVYQRFYDFRPDGLLNFNIVTLFRSGYSAWMQRVNTSLLYPLRQVELEAALTENGFSEIEFYGSMSGEPFDLLASGNLVAVARRV